MPELTFVLPHWLYWGGLVAFPLFAFFMFRRARARTGAERKPVSAAVAYLFLVTGGFIGCHRLYLKSAWAVAFIVLFVAVLLINVESRQMRNLASQARNEISMVESRIEHAQRDLGRAEARLERTDNERNRETRDEEAAKLAKARGQLPGAVERSGTAQARFEAWGRYASIAAGLIAILMLVDAFLIPAAVRRRNALEIAGEVHEHPPASQARDFDVGRERFAVNRWISRLNGFTGEFVAYWSVIAVFVYYFEVISRYVFNSPTNWAHEAMFLMFGMQYLIAGGFVLREGAHVRVDVIYTNLSRRNKALLDVITSVFFFIFVVTLLVTGWIFFNDSLGMSEVSFTEWAIQYYPIKFALPAGAVLLLLQGFAQLVNDIDVLLGTAPEARDDGDAGAGVHHGA